KNDEKNGADFGRLYNWDAAMKACPAGWHLASDADWQDLEKLLGMPESELNITNKWRGTDQGALLMSDTTINFNVVLGGYRNPPSNYNIKDMQGFYWTSTESGGQSYMRQFYNKSTQVFRRLRPHSWSFSVRCIKDEQK
ncbi:MAG: fibrobacter succinogenes major paralogous domain-containing protein, partial [Bacteroidales bacterium]|nr:fibrobacter succinogenes major paralogous domain-containing protein [Bacteroidales bacterium]